MEMEFSVMAIFMLKRRMLVANFPDTYKLVKKDEVSKTFSFPKSFVSYRKPREVCTEQRERARQLCLKEYVSVFIPLQK